MKLWIWMLIGVVVVLIFFHDRGSEFRISDFFYKVLMGAAGGAIANLIIGAEGGVLRWVLGVLAGIPVALIAAILVFGLCFFVRWMVGK